MWKITTFCVDSPPPSDRYRGEFRVVSCLFLFLLFFFHSVIIEMRWCRMETTKTIWSFFFSSPRRRQQKVNVEIIACPSSFSFLFPPDDLSCRVVLYSFKTHNLVFLSCVCILLDDGGRSIFGRQINFFFSFPFVSRLLTLTEKKPGGRKKEKEEVFLLYNGAVFFDVEKKKWGR